MPTVTQVNDLKINKLTKAQYDAAVQAGTIGENEISIITDLDATPQVDSLPTADASQEGKIYQYIGATDSTYTNGYFYKCTETLSFVGPAEDATEGEPGESMVFALDSDAFAAYLQTKSIIVLAGQTTFYLEADSDAETGDSIYTLRDADYVTIEEFTSLADMESTTGITWGGQEDFTGDFPYLAENATGFIVGPTYAWNQIDVQPAGETQYNYTAELEFDPNDSLDVGRIIIKRQQNKCSTAYVRMSIADYYDDSNEWGEASKDSEYLCILQPTTQSSIKACSRVVALEPYQTIWIDCGSQEEDGSPVVMFDLYYNQSDWSQSKAKFIFEISCNDPLDITSTKDLDGGAEEVNVNVMCVPTPIYDPNSTSDRYLVDGGGYQEWRPIPQSEGLPDQTGQSGKFLTTDGTDASWATVDALPDQTGNAGKFLTTDGTDTSWSNKPLVNKATGESCLSILGGVTTGYRNINIGIATIASGSDNTALGVQSEAYGDGSIAIGYVTKVKNVGTWGTGVAIGRVATVSATGAIQLSASQNSATNSDTNTFKVANNRGNFEMMSADGTIPEARLADTTSATQGQVLTLDANNNAVWATPSSGGGVPTLTWYTISTAGTTLTIADTSSARLVKIYKNGLLLQPTEDYTISGTTLTTVSAMVVGDKITTEVF